jgi:hypothetical protein
MGICISSKTEVQSKRTLEKGVKRAQIELSHFLRAFPPLVLPNGWRHLVVVPNVTRVGKTGGWSKISGFELNQGKQGRT